MGLLSHDLSVVGVEYLYDIVQQSGKGATPCAYTELDNRFGAVGTHATDPKRNVTERSGLSDLRDTVQHLRARLRRERPKEVPLQKTLVTVREIRKDLNKACALAYGK